MMSTTRMSLDMARIILRRLSACCSSREIKSSRDSFVTPSTSCATSAPNSFWIISSVTFSQSSTQSCIRPAAIVAPSIIRSASVVATRTGWMKYGSPDLRFWPSCAFSAKCHALSTSSAFSGV